MDHQPEKFDEKWARERLTERLVRYAKVETTSDRHGEGRPTTDGQWDLLRMLVDELEKMGISDVELDANGFIIARLPASDRGRGHGGKPAPVIGFMSHVDTAEDVPGKNVQPRIHEYYDGGVIRLEGGVTIDPKDFPDLLQYRGETIITSDGTTLLGADDKAGLAEIMTAAEWLISRDDFPHGEIELIFTPDEETGKGMDMFPLKKLNAQCCYTMDGDGDGVIEAECFYGYLATVTCSGVSIHPGKGRAKLMNAVSIAAAFVAELPRNESPEATDGRYGFFCPEYIKGNISKAHVEILIRDFDYAEIERRIDVLQKIGQAVQALYPGSLVTVEVTKQYKNMKQYLDKEPRVMVYLREAVRLSGAEIVEKSIRGGTDGARLAEMGVPAPNVFTGGANYHSVREWAALPPMVRATRTILNLVRLWHERPEL